MKLNIARLVILPLSIVAGACAPAAGTQPHDMSAADHQAAAAQNERQASQHSAQYDDKQSKTEDRCTAGKGRVCWTETTNPTDGHAKTAEDYRKLAAQHRAASQALVDAETRECAGLSEEDRDTSPFAHGADIQSVSQFREETKAGGKGPATTRDAGATIVIRAVPGLTAEWLQRVVDCHLARNAAVGHDMPEMAECPLVPNGAQAKVRSVGDGFAVDVRADEPKAAAEIWRRAQELSAAR